jgi:hypothetical protein
MNSKHKTVQEKKNYSIGKMIYRPLFPRPVCLEECTMNIPNGYESDILKTLKSFSNEELYRRKTPHKLEGKDGVWSLDVKSRSDKYRMLFHIDTNNICKIMYLCTEETNK